MKRFLAAFLTVIILISLNSCASRGINQSISYSLSGSPQTLDPQYAKDTSAHIVINNVFEGLVRISGDGEVMPGIAESWSVSPDGLTYSFKLKEGTEWYCSVALKNEFGEAFYKKFSEDLAWETEVWLSDLPDHMIHLNGDKFMGPREKR